MFKKSLSSCLFALVLMLGGVLHNPGVNGQTPADPVTDTRTQTIWIYHSSYLYYSNASKTCDYLEAKGYFTKIDDDGAKYHVYYR